MSEASQVPKHIFSPDAPIYEETINGLRVGPCLNYHGTMGCGWTQEGNDASTWGHYPSLNKAEEAARGL